MKLNKTKTQLDTLCIILELSRSHYTNLSKNKKVDRGILILPFFS